MWVQLHGYRRWPWLTVALPYPRQRWTPDTVTPLHWGPMPDRFTLSHLSLWDEPEGGWCVFPEVPLAQHREARRGDHFHLTRIDISLYVN